MTIKSNRLTAADRLKYARAKVLSRNGNVTETLSVIKELATRYPANASIRAVFANTLVDSGDLQKAAEEFAASVKLRPNREIFSLGLFHCLWDLGKKEEAFEEMKRFMLISDSEDYRKILAEINSNEGR